MDRRSAQIEIVRSAVSGPISSATPTPTPTPSSPSIKVSFKNAQGRPVSQTACAACWNGYGGYSKVEACQTGTEVVINKPGVCNTYNLVLGIILAGGNRTVVTDVSANPTSNFKTYMNQYFGWSDINSWTQGQRNLTITVKPAPRWTPSPRPTPTPTPAKFVCTACAADINKDKKVDRGDYLRISGCYKKKSTEKDKNNNPCSESDINKDGMVDALDYGCFASQINKPCN